MSAPSISQIARFKAVPGTGRIIPSSSHPRKPGTPSTLADCDSSAPPQQEGPKQRPMRPLAGHEQLDRPVPTPAPVPPRSSAPACHVPTDPMRMYASSRSCAHSVQTALGAPRRATGELLVLAERLAHHLILRLGPSDFSLVTARALPSALVNARSGSGTRRARRATRLCCSTGSVRWQAILSQCRSV